MPITAVSTSKAASWMINATPPRDVAGRAPFTMSRRRRADLLASHMVPSFIVLFHDQENPLAPAQSSSMS